MGVVGSSRRSRARVVKARVAVVRGRADSWGRAEVEAVVGDRGRGKERGNMREVKRKKVAVL